MKRKGVITVENQDIFIQECQKKKRDQGKQGGQKAEMQQIVEVAEGSWLDSWSGTMQEEVEVQMDTA